MHIEKFSSILFVDDEELIHPSIISVLNNFSNRVISALNGAEALEIVKEEKPQLIISDINMPYMDGIDFCKEVKKIYPKQFFVFFTAHDDKNLLHEAIKLKVDGFLTKPLDLDNFKSIMSDISEKVHIKKQIALKKELEEKNEFFQNIFDGINDSICIIDEECKPLLLNKTAKEYLDGKKVDISSLKRFYIDNSCDNCTESVCPYDNAIKTKESETSIISTYDVEGKELIEEVSITPLKNKNEKIYGYMEHRKDITELATTQAEVFHKKNYDNLTNIYNIYSFEKKLNEKIAISKNKQIAVIVLDIDNLKKINDSFGLTSGDDVIKHLVLLINSILNDKHTFGRITGDSFAILYEDIKSNEEVIDLIDIINNKLLNNPLNLFFNSININLSLGISIYPEDGISSESLLKNANNALHHSKEDDKNNYEFFNNKLTISNLDNIILETYLKQAVNEKSFELYFQPQHTTINNSLIGAEVLLRWFSSPLGVITPDKFIPILESLNLIQDVTKWILRSVFLKVAMWKKEKLNIGVISINVPVKKLELGDEFVKTIKELLDETKCDPRCINFEVTESMLIKDREKIIKTLREIVNLGFKIAIDDFGTGYSSLAILKSMPIYKLKIDKSFIDGIPNNKDDIVLTKTVIDLARNLNLEVIAEGVETKEQLDFLHENACYEIQGYYYSKPLKEEDFISYIK